MKRKIMWVISWIVWKTVGHASYRMNHLRYGSCDPVNAPMLYKTFLWHMSFENDGFIRPTYSELIENRGK